MENKRCRDCDYKQSHVTSANGKLFWYCNNKHTVVHASDYCKNVKDKRTSNRVNTNSIEK